MVDPAKKIVLIPEAAPESQMRKMRMAGGRPSRCEICEQRRQHLHDFAHRYMSQVNPGAQLKSAANELPPGFRVLEGVGALVMDVEHHNEDLAKRMGAKAYENVRIASVAPLESSEPGTAPDFWHLDAINVAALRDKGLDGTGVVVGLMDSGIDPSHQEFAGKKIYTAEFDAHGEPVKDAKPRDAGVHGTHVSGLTAGKTAGVAPGASLAMATVLTEVNGTAGYLAQILAGLNWLVTEQFGDDPNTPGVHLVNASLESATGFNDFLYNTIKTARIAPGTIAIGAVGNSGRKGSNHDASPGNYDIVIGVGAVDRNHQVAPFSAWGNRQETKTSAKPDLTAPGVAIWSCISGAGNQYAAMDGTSMASPIVCGAAALLLQQEPSLAEDIDAFRDKLMERIKPLPEQKERAGAGVLSL